MTGHIFLYLLKLIKNIDKNIKTLINTPENKRQTLFKVYMT